MIRQYHVTVLSNFLSAYDKYTRTYDKNRITQSSYPRVFFLLNKDEINIGINKATGLLAKLNLPGNRLLVIETEVDEADLKNNELTGTGLGRYIEDTKINVVKVYYLDSEHLVETIIEDVVADAYRAVRRLLPNYSELKPRSVSILPVAKGCQAKCPFCFSSASISDEIEQNKLDMERVRFTLVRAKQQGAERAVITGGGEPGILPYTRLLELIRLCKQYFSKVVLITNGYFIASSDKPEDKLKGLIEAGLTVLSISHHHYLAQNNHRLMNLDVDVDRISKAYKTIKADRLGFQLRLICVLQKGAVDSVDEMQNYINWAAESGINQVCFKELYVSSSRESYFYEKDSNKWSYENQVPLSLLVNYAVEQGWSRLTTLPWGSPVYVAKTNAGDVQVAAYTEPSLSWELENKLCRSWNLMADGRCYSSLETRESEVLIAN